MDWNSDAARGDGRRVAVPVLSLQTVYRSVPDHVAIGYIKTDMQGADFAAVSSLPIAELRKTPFLLTEVWMENVQSFAARE